MAGGQDHDYPFPLPPTPRPPDHDPHSCAFQAAVSEDDVMMPHAFERLWSALSTQGEFQTHITEAVSQGQLVRHLNNKGFQVRAIRAAPGAVDGVDQGFDGRL